MARPRKVPPGPPPPQLTFEFEHVVVGEVPLRQLYIEQIRRDMQTLKLGPDWCHPDVEFYEKRIAMYREVVNELDAKSVVSDG